MRGGCACAGTYGHYLLNVTHDYSRKITELINHGDLSQKPGWIRWSIHPTTSNQEIDYIVNAVAEIAKNHPKWSKDYHYHKHNNEFVHHQFVGKQKHNLDHWFALK
jgi:UDP-N-acetylglucosamine 2-epimerase